jgi:hypothetical protein
VTDAATMKVAKRVFEAANDELSGECKGCLLLTIV